MKLLKKLMCLVITLTMVLSCVPAGMFSASAAEAYKPGLDIIILMDISFSNFPGNKENPYDKEMMCLDAATMLINMCDSEYSRVAVVPFTDKIPGGSVWNQWIDVSNPANRVNLCNELYSAHMLYADSAKWHNGYTNPTVAMNAAYDLMANRTTNNPVLIVVLGDSQVSDPAIIEGCIEVADSIKGEATIYCLDMGTYSGKTDNDLLLFNIASGDGYKDGYYWRDITPADLKVLFSDIFADMIGSNRITESANVNGDNIVYNLYIPNESVTEVNLVLDRSQLSGADFELTLNGEPVSNSENLITYTYTKTDGNVSGYPESAITYDFISVKLINPQPGEWSIIAPKAEEVDNSTALSYDILFNYQIEPMVYATADTYYKSQDVELIAQFVSEDGTPSSDKALYRGNIDPAHPGIEAMVYIYDAAGNSIGSFTMEPSQETLSFGYTFDLATLGDLAAGNNTFYYEVNVRGDHMNKTSPRNAFTVVNTCPALTGASEIMGGNLQIANVFATGDDVNGRIVMDNAALNGYFTDADGDVLTFTVEETSGVNARMNDGSLVIEKLDDEIREGAYVVVKASDSAGQSAEAKIFVNVLSVKGLVAECVNVSVVPSVAGTDLVKGDVITVEVNYEINVPAGADKSAFPYSYLNDVISVEALKNSSAVSYSFDVNGDIAGVDNGDGTATITVGTVDNATIVVTAAIEIGTPGNITTKTAVSDTYTVKNAAPVCVDITEGMTATGANVAYDAEGNALVSFEIDRDKPAAEMLTFNIGEWFTDEDVANGYDAFNYYVTIDTLEETKDIFAFPRSLLRMIGLADKEGVIVKVNGVDADITGEEITGIDVYQLGTASEVKFDAMRFGNARVTVIAVDKDGVEASQTFEYNVYSSVENLMCIIVYIILLIILIIIIIVLINKLVIHQPWPGKRAPGFRVQLNGFDQMTMDGSTEAKFSVKGRAVSNLRTVARQFNINDDNAGSAVFGGIILWPTLGDNIRVELSKKAKMGKATVKVDGNPVGKKSNWGRNGRIIVSYEDSMGNAYECVFKRD